MNPPNSRRDFIKTVAAAAVLGAVNSSRAGAPGQALAMAGSGAEDRGAWIAILEKLADPVLRNLARRELRKAMPVETRAGAGDRSRFTHLEAFGRLLSGISPWLGARGLGAEESSLRDHFREMALVSLDSATDPASPDFMNFSNGGQPLVDAAFLAQAILRSRSALWEPLEARVKGQVVAALKSSRAIPTPDANNWVMFAATVEAALLGMGEPTVGDRLEGCLRRMLGWYRGDGAYGDGEWFHFDYYNSFVIHPMLLDVLEALRQRDGRFGPAREVVLHRARRYAEIQERLVAPDGTFPPLGRSVTYRFGALQLLAQVSLMRELPKTLAPAQVRGALTAAMRRTMEAPGTFDEAGWLRIGLCGHQPTLGERYISTGSLYLCSAGLLPLGLPADDPFWRDPPARWTSQRLWSGESLPADHAIEDVGFAGIPTLSP